MNDNSKRYGKCPKCGEYAVHLFNPPSYVCVYGDALDALGNDSIYNLEARELEDFWVHACAKCEHVIAIGFGDDSFIRNEPSDPLAMAIKNDAMIQALIDLENMYPEEVGNTLERYGIKP